MGKTAKIWVKATSRGQRPDGVWVNEASPPFTVDEGAFSKRWMGKVSEAEAVKLTAAAKAEADANGSNDELTAVTKERDDLAGQVKVLEAERDKAVEAGGDLAVKLAKAEAEIEALKKKLVEKAPEKPPASVAGDKK